MKIIAITAITVSYIQYVACGVIFQRFDENRVEAAQQPSAHELSHHMPTIRNLTWGQLNFIHTTDTHGWLSGHLLEPSFSADWGDLYSFVKHMKRNGINRRADVLLVDTGDRIDGNGLSDATSPGGVFTGQLFLEQDYDLITVGNHELYKYEAAVTDYQIIGSHFKDRYVVSNVDIMINNTWVPMGNRYRQFTTKIRKLNIIGYGFMFNFVGNCPETRVTLVESAVRQDWFKESLSHNNTDVFVVLTHVPVHSIHTFPEIHIIFDAIRKVHPNAVVQFFCGHSHVRDFEVLDTKATALESGRFLETVGWVSIDNLDKKLNNNNVTFSRTYIDANVRSYSHHTNTLLGEKDIDKDSEQKIFFTKKGLEISDKIKHMRKSLNLEESYGCVPKNYMLNRAKYPGPDNLYSLLEDTILPRLVGTNVSLSRSMNHSRYILLNTGSIRFDLFKGLFTRDSRFIVSPFATKWLYIPDMPLKYAKRILPELNKYPYIFSTDAGECDDENTNPHLEKGYVTHDDAGSDGDDTLNSSWDFHLIPNAIQASQNIHISNENIPAVDEDIQIDVVFYDFMKPFILEALTKIGYDHNNDTVLQYGGPSVADMLTEYVVEFWSACE